MYVDVVYSSTHTLRYSSHGRLCAVYSEGTSGEITFFEAQPSQERSLFSQPCLRRLLGFSLNFATGDVDTIDETIEQTISNDDLDDY